MGYCSSLLAIVHASEVHEFKDALVKAELDDSFDCENIDPDTGGLVDSSEYFIYEAHSLKWYSDFDNVMLINSFFENSKASSMQRVGEVFNDIETYGDKPFICFNNRVETELDLYPPEEEEDEY